jgi:hypothetical protein
MQVDATRFGTAEIARRQRVARTALARQRVALASVLFAGALGCAEDRKPTIETDQRGLEGPTFGDSNGPELRPGELGGAAACQGETRASETIAVDLLLMVDASGSMLETVPLTGASKWDAVRSAIESFVTAPATQGIGVGLQYFPQVRTGVPATCDNNTQCGAGGPCSNSQCVQPDRTRLSADPDVPPAPFLRRPTRGVVNCDDRSDCSPGESCRTVVGECVAVLPRPGFVSVLNDPQGQESIPLCGVQADCDGLPGTVCQPIGICANAANLCSTGIPCPGGLACLTVPQVCVDRTLCEVADYAAPAVPISSAANRGFNIVTSLARQVPDPNGLTPTGPALAGALQQAKAWALQNPGHQVLAVLVTDGFPTVCEPQTLDGLAGLARAALADSPSVKTFVVGVFSQGDLGDDGRDRLNTVALAGGTTEALVVNTQGNVAATFLENLNRIRDTALSCEFQLDDSENLDFDRVNLIVTDAAGTSQPQYNVQNAGGCSGGAEGWYYVRDAQGAPQSLEVCPRTCERLRTEKARAELQVGCSTLLR